MWDLVQFLFPLPLAPHLVQNAASEVAFITMKEHYTDLDPIEDCQSAVRSYGITVIKLRHYELNLLLGFKI